MTGVGGFAIETMENKLEQIAFSFIFLLHRAIPSLSFFTGRNHFVGGIKLLYAQTSLICITFPGCFVYPVNKNVFSKVNYLHFFPRY